MQKRILVTVAHPDDEAFGPGGTIAKYTAEGVNVHILSATRGESGQLDEILRSKIKDQRSKIDNKEIKIQEIREKELINSAKTLGVSSVEFMDYIDGQLCNNLYHKITARIMDKIHDFKPQVILTMDRLGVSGHIDHITVSLATTYSFLHTHEPLKLYYEVMTKKDRLNQKRLDDYFIYFPEGYDEDEITTKIDYSKYFEKKKKAMLMHESQMNDVRNILKNLEDRPKVDNLILQYHRGIEVNLPETDLFSGIK
jgi:N-acetylglucosamine malate deacetylase 2